MEDRFERYVKNVYLLCILKKGKCKHLKERKLLIFEIFMVL